MTESTNKFALPEAALSPVLPIAQIAIPASGSNDLPNAESETFPVATNRADNVAAVEPQSSKPSEVTLKMSVPGNSVVKSDSIAEKTNAGSDENRLIHDELAAARLKLMEIAAIRKPGKLGDLERKALEYDSITSKLEMKDLMIAKFSNDLKAAQSMIAQQQHEIGCLQAITNELTVKMDMIKKEAAPIKEALDILRMGKYEYYQVEAGDTCESIAAKPSIYNDPVKGALIRQTNRGNVSNLDKLIAGEVLIIPRISMSDKHDF